MLPLSVVFKRKVAEAYETSTAELTYLRLRGKTGRRSFERVAVVAALGRTNGIAAGARLQWELLRQLGIDAELLDATAALRNPLSRIPHRPASAYIFHSGAPQTAALVSSVLPHAMHAYRIAYWAWELPDPPLDWGGCDRIVSEVWTPSRFARESLSRLTSLPIHVVPHCVPAKPPRKRDTEQPFTVLTMADSRSSFARKNPEGALRAFHAAFPSGPFVARLVLKLGGRAKDRAAFKRQFDDLLQAPNITVIEDALDEAGMAALYRSTDVFLSLHRAEGYGLPMREAMAYGIPLVATGWSGNTDFMPPSVCMAVPYRLVPVLDEAGIYADSLWADPSIPAAASALRQLASDAELYERLAKSAHAHVAETRPELPLSYAQPSARFA